MTRTEKRQEALAEIRNNAVKIGLKNPTIDRTLRRQFARAEKHRRNLLKRMGY